jgi:PAS domain S-box-containing protein
LSPNQSPPHSFSLAKLALRNDRDLLSLTRRTRSAGSEFGLHPREVRGLSSATYEAARAAVRYPDTDAEVRLADGPSLEVVFRIPAGGPDERAAIIEQMTAATDTLRAMVHDVEIETSGRGVTVGLRAMFPTSAAERLQAWASAQAKPRVHPKAEEVPADELEARYRELNQAFNELQAELEETNRGVVALHAELELQAEQLRSAEDRLRLLLDGVQDYAICMLTPQGEIASWNSGGERLFHYRASEIIGRNVACFYPPVEREIDMPADHLRAADERGRLAFESQWVGQGGESFDAHVVLTPVRRGSELRGFSLVVRDITERKRLEADLRRRAEELAAANRAKEDFLATLSHELRTPLNAMLGWTRLLRMGKLDQAGMSRALETIERNAHMQEQLIADILDLSRIVTGRLRVDLRPIDLSPVVAAAIDTVSPAAQAKGVRLVPNAPFHGSVLGDPDRLQQVVWNLLVNAIKFTPPAGTVTVSIARLGPSAVITVADTGEGMSAELLPFIFDRFTQGDASVTRPHGGLGLGLSIVRHIVELHGGKVVAHSAGPGRGSTFSVHLPVRAVQQPAVDVPEEPSHRLAGLKVLVVDDDADAREVVSLALAQCGARTAAVSSARDALRMLTEFRPDVLVSDIGMPGEDGYSLIRRVRALRTGVGDVPAIALTAYAQPEDQQRALGAGFQEFVPKPVEVSALAAVVRALADRVH